MKVAICTPTPGEVKTKFLTSLLQLLTQTHGHQLFPATATATLHVESRNSLVAEARKLEADYILWLDADQTFPPDTLMRLLAHGLPFVGCNYPRRTLPFAPTAVLDGKPVWTTPEKVRHRIVEQVDGIGLGVALTATALFDGLDPAFAFQGTGEDSTLCLRLRPLGIRPHVDHALSWEIGHLAEIELRNEHSLMERGRNAGSVRSPSRRPK